METLYKLAVFLVFCVFGQAKSIVTNGSSVILQGGKQNEDQRTIMSADRFLQKLYGSYVLKNPNYSLENLQNLTHIAEKNVNRYESFLDTRQNLRNHVQTFSDKIVQNKMEPSLANSLLKKVIDDSYDMYRSRDCRESTTKTSGVRFITTGRMKPFQVMCNMDIDGGNWTVIQQRQDGSVDFKRTWQEYKNGFGNLDGDFWLGNNKIHTLTTHGLYELRVDIESWDGSSWYAVYNKFQVGDEKSKYKLIVGTYTGSAGDALKRHNNKMFSTIDQDNDNSAHHCSEQYSGGGWWFDNCHDSNLNGLYGEGIGYSGVDWNKAGLGNYSMKFARMMIRQI